MHLIGNLMGLNKELDGILVVSLEQAVAAPYCGLLLADAGARVIKIERPTGDFSRAYDSSINGHSAIFAWLNRGKESICLNLKNYEDIQTIQAILTKADIFLSNLAPGAVTRMGLDGKTLRLSNPELITCSITGYGESKKATAMKAYDFLVQAESGVCAATGTKNNPSRVGVSLTDLSSGLTAFSAILRALIQRNSTGRGIDLSVSMFDVIADWMNMNLLAHRYMGGAPGRTGLQHGFIAPYGAFNCKNEEQVLLSIQNNREWAEFCSFVLQQPELIDDIRFCNNPERFNNRVELDALVNKCFSKYDKKAVIKLLDKASIANATLNSVADLSNHSFLKNAVAQTGGKEISFAALPIHTVAISPNEVPTLGQHSNSIKTEFSCHSDLKQN